MNIHQLDAAIATRINAAPGPSQRPAETAHGPILAAMAGGGLDGLVKAFECVKTRACVECGADFEAVGFQAYCEPCGILVDEKASLPPVAKLDSSWPRLHAEKIQGLLPCAHPVKSIKGGRQWCATCMAKEMAPKLFGNRILVLAGDRGRGKTQIATFCAYHRMMKGHDSGVYARAFDAVGSISGLEREKKLIAFQRVPFLCLDECHRVEPKYLPTLESIIDARYSNKRPTVIIGNWMTPEGMEHGEVVSGQKLHGLGPTLMDRINEHTANRTGGVVWCRWDSYRKPLTQTGEPETSRKLQRL